MQNWLQHYKKAMLMLKNGKDNYNSIEMNAVVFDKWWVSFFLLYESKVNHHAFTYLKVSTHHPSNDGEINETQELKNLLDNADQRNHEQEQVLFLTCIICIIMIWTFLENYSTWKSSSTLSFSNKYFRKSFSCMYHFSFFHGFILF